MRASTSLRGASRPNGSSRPASGSPRTSATRRERPRPSGTDDLALAVRADERAGPGGTGLALVARRCPTVWLISRTLDPDPLALRLSAILASVLLGPILDARVPELFGVKTAREKMEQEARKIGT